MSIGFRRLASEGRKEASSLRVPSESGEISSLKLTQASVAMMAGPPALVTIATLLPAGTGQRSSAWATSKSSSIESARRTPHCSRNAEIVRSCPARAPVWLEAARAPSAVRPDLTMRIGFLRETRLAIAVKLRGLPTDSRYIAITRVAGSFSQYSRRSLAETSALFPIETNWVSPRPRSAAACRMATPRAPDWLTKPTEPDRAGEGAKVALRETSTAVLITPMQFGPIIRRPAPRDPLDDTPLDRPSLFTGLGESGRDDDEATDPLLDTLLHHALDERAGHSDHHQVHRIRNRGQAGIGLERVNHRRLWIHRKDRAVELVDDQVMDEGKADGASPPRSSHHRHRTRREDPLQRLDLRPHSTASISAQSRPPAQTSSCVRRRTVQTETKPR